MYYQTYSWCNWYVSWNTPNLLSISINFRSLYPLVFGEKYIQILNGLYAFERVKNNEVLFGNFFSKAFFNFFKGDLVYLNDCALGSNLIKFKLVIVLIFSGWKMKNNIKMAKFTTKLKESHNLQNVKIYNIAKFLTKLTNGEIFKIAFTL